MNSIVKKDNKKIFTYDISVYPACCGLGIVSGFSSLIDGEFTEEDEMLIIQDIEKRMWDISVSSILLADIEENIGYKILSKNVNTVPLSLTFNNNSGNCIFLLQYTPKK